MKKILLFMLASTATLTFGMRKEQDVKKKADLKKERVIKKEFCKEGILPIYVDNIEIKKAIVVVAPSNLSKGKAETYFRKNSIKVSAKMKELVALSLSLILNDTLAPAEYNRPINFNEDLYKLIVHPESRFIHKDGIESVFIERELSKDERGWYFTLLMEVTPNEQVASKAICSPLTVQMNHDAANIHDKIWVSELKDFYAESVLPPIQTIDGEKFVEKTACPDDAYMEVRDFDEMLQLVTRAFIRSNIDYKKYPKE